MIYVILAIVLLILVYFSISYFLSGTILFLNRQSIPKNPKDYGLNFEEVVFKTSDGVAIKGWLIPGTSKKLVIITHVGGLTKYGSTKKYRNITKLYNKEIEFIRTAEHLNNRGYWVLMFDFRNHGQSGKSPNGGKAGIGLEEYKDVLAAMDFIRGRKDLEGFDTGFVSFCMGANSTIIAMSREPEAFEHTKCLVAIQPISMKVFIKTYAKRIFTPPGAKLILPMVEKFVNKRSQYTLEKMSPRDSVKGILVPTLYVQARNDPWTDLSDILGFYDNTPESKDFFWIEDTKHRFESYSYFQDTPDKMLEWLSKWL